MNRWTRVNLALGLLLSALLLAQWLPRDPGNGGERLTAVDAAAVRSVRVEHQRRLALALNRQDGDWHLSHPHDAAAAPRRVAQLLAVLDAPLQQHFDATASLAAYGLDPPQAVLDVDGVRLAFGDRDPTQRGRYVLVDGRIGVIDDLYFNLLTLPPRHYRVD